VIAKSQGKESIAGLVSVIVPAYNAEAGLRRCIESILAQTYKPLELIVINDGSPDGTEAVALDFGEKIRYVSQKNQGETATRNRGIALARGEYISFLDHDDHWRPEFVESSVDFLREHPEVVGVVVGSEHISALKDEKIIRPAFLAESSNTAREAFVIGDLFDFWATYHPRFIGAVLLRRSVINAAGDQRANLVLSGDLEYWAYLATFGKWGFIPAVLVHIDGTQALRSGNVYAKYYERYKRCPTVEEWQERILPRLSEADMPGFERVRGYIATWFVFARVFVGEDSEALRTARKYKEHLHGKFGRLWRLAQIGGMLTWKPICWAVRLRTRLQYRRKTRRARRRFSVPSCVHR